MTPAFAQIVGTRAAIEPLPAAPDLIWYGAPYVVLLVLVLLLATRRKSRPSRRCDLNFEQGDHDEN